MSCIAIEVIDLCPEFEALFGRILHRSLSQQLNSEHVTSERLSLILWKKDSHLALLPPTTSEDPNPGTDPREPTGPLALSRLGPRVPGTDRRRSGCSTGSFLRIAWRNGAWEHMGVGSGAPGAGRRRRSGGIQGEDLRSLADGASGCSGM